MSELSDKKQPGIRAQRKAERPKEILDAAFEVFVEHGYAATRVEDIAERIGVTKGTVYFYFETKERLFEETLRHASVSFADVSAYCRTLQGPYAERIKAFVRMVYARIATDRNSRELLRFVIADGPRFPQMVDRHCAEQIEPMFAAAGELFQAGVAAGELRDSPMLKFPEICLGPSILMIISHLIFADRKTQDIEGFIDGHIDLLLNGMLVRD